jgi:hypothetical protein
MKHKMSLAVVVLLAAAAAVLTGCSGAEKLSTSPALPSSEGSLKCEKAANDNTGIDLKVKHLANPDRLTPPASAYVVWTRADKGSAPQNIGALEVDKNLSGHLKTVTALRRFELFITAEPAGATQTPSGSPLMWANCSR